MIANLLTTYLCRLARMIMIVRTMLHVISPALFYDKEHFRLELFRKFNTTKL